MLSFNFSYYNFFYIRILYFIIININNFSITSFQDLKDLFNKYMDFLGSFDLQEQILIFNSLNSFFLLSLLSSFLFNKYGNFLITKFKLVEKYPKIYRLYYYRSQVQKYYFMYISFLAITSLIFILFINLSILLKICNC